MIALPGRLKTTRSAALLGASLALLIAVLIASGEMRANGMVAWSNVALALMLAATILMLWRVGADMLAVQQTTGSRASEQTAAPTSALTRSSPGMSGGDFLQAVIDAVPDPLMVIDRDYRVVLANRVMREAHLGGGPLSCSARCHQLSHGRDTPCREEDHPCPLERVIATREPVTVTHTHVGPDGKDIIVEIVAGPILDENGEVVKIVESCRDVTARVRAEDQARQRQAEMAHVERLGTMGEMAAGLAHELNQPLSAIVNYTQACLERIRSGASEPYDLLDDLEQAATQAERAGEIVEHVRQFVGKGQAERCTADLNQLLRTALDLLGAELRRNDVHVNLDLAEAMPPIEVVGIQVEQVIVNLIQNGLEASLSTATDGGKLDIRTWVGDDRTVEFQIKDDGPGLPPEGNARVFDAFFTTKPNGTGMGLSISRSIIEAHGGRLWAADNSDNGATFRFTLPANGGGHGNEP